MITTSDSLQFIKGKGDKEFNIIYADPPYALGSEIMIRPNGKVDYSKAADFMSKWEMPTGEYWEQWFKEAFRTLKYGGYLILFGIDRQTLLFKYYAALAGFTEKQSLYWYFISNFPKATDLSKMLDKVGGKSVKWFGEWLRDWRKKNNITQKEIAELFPSASGGLTGCVANWELGLNVPTPEQFTKIVQKFNLPFETLEQAEREVVGKGSAGFLEKNNTFGIDNDGYGNYDLTAPSTDLAKKYDGYKYSIAPLKQTNETIMVFMKPTKTGSPLHDTLAYESGDDSINVSALDIDGNRVEINDGENIERKHTAKTIQAFNENPKYNLDKIGQVFTSNEKGRYPSQTFIDNEAAQVIDEQSGVSGGGGAIKEHDRIDTIINFGNKQIDFQGYDDIGGASKILHKCKFDQDDLTLYYYEPKVGNGERNAGLGGFEEKLSAASEFRPNHLEKTLQGENGNPYGRWKPLQNNHPTLKPIDLNYRILKLFKTPNPQSILYPFAGSGSEIIGGIKAGFDNWVGCEINPEYVEIANARIKYWKESMWEQQSLFEETL